MNIATLVGRLTKPPELKFATNGKAVTSFTLAVDRKFKNEAGDREADFIPIVVWGKTAEWVAENCDKGFRVGVTGRIQVRNYTTQQGDKRYVTEIVADSVEALQSLKKLDNVDPSAYGEVQPDGDYDPFEEE